MNRTAAWLLVAFFSQLSFAAPDFPMGPHPRLTPGSLCDQPTEFRYREHMPYCERDVARELKAIVFQEYRKLGFPMTSRSPQDYKIDHYIPLCLGGSNHPNNLWPQHVSIYTQTDALEALLCEKLQTNRMQQREAVTIIRAVKNNLSLLPSTMRKLHAL